MSLAKGAAGIRTRITRNEVAGGRGRTPPIYVYVWYILNILTLLYTRILNSINMSPHAYKGRKALLIPDTRSEIDFGSATVRLVIRGLRHVMSCRWRLLNGSQSCRLSATMVLRWFCGQLAKILISSSFKASAALAAMAGGAGGARVSGGVGAAMRWLRPVLTEFVSYWFRNSYSYGGWWWWLNFGSWFCGMQSCSSNHSFPHPLSHPLGQPASQPARQPAIHRNTHSYTGLNFKCAGFVGGKTSEHVC